MVKYLQAMQEVQETQVQSLGWEDTLEEGMATRSRLHGAAWWATVCRFTKSWTQLK